MSVRGNPSPGDFTLDASDNRSMISSILRWPFGPINFNTPEIMTKMMASFCFQETTAESSHVLASVKEIPQSLHRIFLLSSPNFFHRSTNCGRAAGAPEQALLQLPGVRKARVRCNVMGQVLLFKGISNKWCPLTSASLRLAACSNNFRPKDFFPNGQVWDAVQG